MKFSVPVIIAICTLCIIASCEKYAANAGRVVIIQPFADFNPALTRKTFTEIKAVSKSVLLNRSVPLPNQAYYVPRNRYRADKLLNYLSAFGNADTVVIGLTNKDISTTKGKIKDWGIMGLGYCPGNACVVSTFRLKKNNLTKQFYKLVLHELGHTQGLDHCATKTCFMRDAEGGNPLDDEQDFCATCKAYLKKGWQL